MKIVIDIPEELFGKINDENYQSLISWYDTTLYCAIKDGTPLPKGHGDLVDKDTITVEEDVYFQNYIIHAPIVIPADEENKE